jgi:hypothetical protein
MILLSKIISRFKDRYLATYQHTILPGHRRALGRWSTADTSTARTCWPSALKSSADTYSTALIHAGTGSVRGVRAMKVCE